MKVFVFGSRAVGLILYWWRVCNFSEKVEFEVLVVLIEYSERIIGIWLLIN